MAQQQAPQKRQPRQATRLELLDAAERVFARSGIAAASIEDIVQEAGYSRGAFYSSFTDKDDIVMAVSERQMDFLLEALQALLAEQPTPEVLVAALTEDDDPAWSGPDARRYQEELAARSLSNPDLRRRGAELERHIRAGVGEGFDRVWRRLPYPAEDVASVVLGMARGLVRQQAVDPEVDADRIMRDVAMPLILAGLKALGARPR